MSGCAWAVFAVFVLFFIWGVLSEEHEHDDA